MRTNRRRFLKGAGIAVLVLGQGPGIYVAITEDKQSGNKQPGDKGIEDGADLSDSQRRMMEEKLQQVPVQPTLKAPAKGFCIAGYIVLTCPFSA